MSTKESTTASSSRRTKKQKQEEVDYEDDDTHLYIPDPKSASKLRKVNPSKEPRIRKYLSVSKPELQRWLRHNGQLITGRKHDLLLKCIDGELNGRIPGCPSCHLGQMHYDYSEGAYVCNGYFDDMAHNPIRCGHVQSHVKREHWRDPDKDSPIDKGEGKQWSSSSDRGEAGPNDEEHHHKDHPDHHHHEHNCKVPANHPLVDLLEDMAYFHSVKKDENWGFRSRAFISAARAVEHLPFEIDGKVHEALSLGNRRDVEHHVGNIGKSSAEVMQAFLDSGKTRSPHLEELKASLRSDQKKGGD